MEVSSQAKEDESRRNEIEKVHVQNFEFAETETEEVATRMIEIITKDFSMFMMFFLNSVVTLSSPESTAMYNVERSLAKSKS